MHCGLKHDWSEQSALSRTLALTFPLLGPIRARFPYDGPVPLPANAPIPIAQTSGVSGPPGKSSGWTEPSAGREEEEGNPVSHHSSVHLSCLFAAPKAGNDLVVPCRHIV